MGNDTTARNNTAEKGGEGGSSHAIGSYVGEEGGGGAGGAGVGAGGARECGVRAGAEPAQAIAATLGAIIMDASRPARLDALKSILSFLTPGEVQAFLEVGIGPEEQLVFEGLRQEGKERVTACVSCDSRLCSRRSTGFKVLRLLLRVLLHT
eukprot:evm.model.NODE_5168_length_23940_cov_50.421009.1